MNTQREENIYSVRTLRKDFLKSVEKEWNNAGNARLCLEKGEAQGPLHRHGEADA